MSDTPVDTPAVPEQRSYSGLFLALLAVAVVAAIAGLAWSYHLSGRLTNTEAQLAQAQQNNQKLSSALDETNARLKVTTETLGHSLGMTQQQLETRAQALLRRQEQQEAEAKRLASQQAATAQQVSSVSTDVSGVKTDVGGVRTDLTQTQSDLKNAVSQLQTMRGDLNGASTLIARNHDELEILKHKGDRNYYEFSLQKGAQPTLLSTIKLQLKKADQKHSRYTLNVSSDDRIIEKKDKGLDEPVQFYTGKDPALYELVVNSIEKNKVSGYLSTPKSKAVSQ
jgi:chromosome segregation ATPase